MDINKSRAVDYTYAILAQCDYLVHHTKLVGNTSISGLSIGPDSKKVYHQKPCG